LLEWYVRYRARYRGNLNALLGDQATRQSLSGPGLGVGQGIPVEIERNGKLLKSIAAEPVDKLRNLKPYPDYLGCDPEEIVHLDWSDEWKP
jgi:hypothetical protein